jgi:hypothetical protein
MMVCQSNIEGLYKKLDGVYGADKAKREKLHGVEMVARIFERLKWPFSKVECQQIVKTLHRCTQTFEFSGVRVYLEHCADEEEEDSHNLGRIESEKIL